MRIRGVVEKVHEQHHTQVFGDRQYAVRAAP
jgi:hypothetical protein